MMSDWAAWGDDMMDLDRDGRGQEIFVNWQQRGRFKCEHCERVLTTLGGLKSHMEAVHSVSAVALREKLKADQKSHAAAEKARREVERREAEARKHRKVILSTDQIDEIVSEMNGLIGMMESYWSQGDCDRDARALIAKLEAMADGKAPFGPTDKA